MHILSVNVGEARSQPRGASQEITGIFKMPKTEAVQVKRLGIVDDFIGDAKHHGGPDQAIYIYGEADYEWWTGLLGRELQAGTFGENLTVSGLESAGFSIGDRLHVGSVVLEVTAPRNPCMTLARRMGDPMFVRVYRRAERPGLYCRVVHEGRLRQGDEIKHEAFAGEAVTALDIFREHYALERSEATLRRFLDAPLSVRTRTLLNRQLERLLERA